MGSKGGIQSPLPSPSPVVCCMCGDHGLLQELFRCKVCLVRSQHKYCSNLYPKVESYRVCNWCLREGVGKPLRKEAITDHNNSVSPPPPSDYNSGSSSAGAIKLNRGAFPTHLDKPVKKQRVPAERSSPNVIDRLGSEELSPSSGSGRQVIRGKVRRYKLLEEVSS